MLVQKTLSISERVNLQFRAESTGIKGEVSGLAELHVIEQVVLSGSLLPR